ncbi:MAG TPA: 1-deoxy-D-xylulose-5-phosphate synthase [Tepidisphaeraceae bacterium]|nr:1-deoxy-D-xylulose-5-phosphate synthase [Tepidisphaeraceae bacterium]
MPLLDRISCPGDLRKLSLDELERLAQECRQLMFDAVSKNGGHLASNLGVVELTLALHYVYEFGPYPQGPDRLLWDVGHQCYVHKLLTGRAKYFEHLRKKGSISGFPTPLESPYDLFAVGHAGTAISTAVGVARGDALMKRNSHVVAVVGDASIVNGLAFEGLNNAGMLKRQLLIVLNDNGMSISKPQGALAQYLERVRLSSTYDEAKRLAQRVVGRLPTGVGQTIESVWHHVKEGVKGSLWSGQIFEALGIKYLGPLEGHDLATLITMLAEVKDVTTPVLLHVKTIKGKGYDAPSKEPTKFHSPAGFKVAGCRVEFNGSSGRSWTSAFADAMIDLARTDSRVVGLTAAMPDGTGLSKFEKEFPDRYYDAGICESHLMALAAGMAKAGMRPFAAIYSTFMQRAFDQVWQEVVLNQLPVVLCMDRAGYVGDDGAVHHGFMDQAFLRPMPGMVLMAPSDEAELRRCLKLAVSLDTPSAVRYPRDNVPTANFETVIAEPLREAASQDWQVGKSRVLREGTDATILSYGALTLQAMEAADELAAEGLSVGVVDARFCKPVDGEMLTRVLRSGAAVLTLEDHSLQNGFASAVAEYAVAHGLPTGRLGRLGMPDRMIGHATRKQQLAEVGLDAAGIARSVRDAVRAVEKTNCAAAPLAR